MRISLPRNFRFVFLPVVLVLFCCLSMALAQPSSDVPVTSTIYNVIDDPLSGPIPMDIQNDGLGSYVTVLTKGGYRVKSIVQGIGDWELDTGLNVKNPNRQVWIDLTHPVGANASFGRVLVRPRFLAQASEYGNSLFTIVNGATVQAQLITGFDYNNARYRIHMNPDSPYIPYPETDYVNITCLGVDPETGQCNHWQIKPDGDKGGCLTPNCSVKRNIVKLVKLVTTRNQTAEVDLGDYYMTFSIDITNP